MSFFMILLPERVPKMRMANIACIPQTTSFTSNTAGGRVVIAEEIASLFRDTSKVTRQRRFFSFCLILAVFVISFTTKTPYCAPIFAPAYSVWQDFFISFSYPSYIIFIFVILLGEREQRDGTYENPGRDDSSAQKKQRQIRRDRVLCGLWRRPSWLEIIT